ncbi:hypothetical protein [Tumebacillus sp. BK434]|uniref:hypothetical protein n=1 Tax=Tumebacillus sp. BK434 TaxID=2512169 RepID=UPI00140435EB|nr:hypothetical protein [Tumebacillus sp. BK434]
MDAKLVLVSMAIVVIISLTFGVVIMLWSYGVKDIRLLLSPIISIFSYSADIVVPHGAI